MKILGVKHIIPILLLFFLAVPACVIPPEEEPESVAASEAQFLSLLDEAEINYAVPVSVPNIMVNQLGYLTDSVKMAVFRGENLPEDFALIDSASGRTVYEGLLESRGYDEERGEHISYGYFSDFATEGSYYVEARIVGRSYTFSIGDNLYDHVFRLSARQYYLNRCGVPLVAAHAGSYARDACHIAPLPLRENADVILDVSGGWHQDGSGSRDVAIICNVISTLLLSYELAGEVYSDATNIPESGNGIPDILDEIRHAVDWLLKMQDADSYGVYAGITHYMADIDGEAIPSGESYIEPITYEATALFCATMAGFSYLYQEFDETYAARCFRAADRAYRHLGRNYAELADELHFQAAAQMYRASGGYSYHTAVTRYLGGEHYQTLFCEGEGSLSEQEGIIKGVTTYLLTRKQVNKDLCAEIMKTIMQMAEDISASARFSSYQAPGNVRQDNNSELLHDAFVMAIVNHVITNHEYGTVIENYFHYLCGRNSVGISYIDEVGELSYKDVDNRLGVTNHIEMNSKLLFVLCEIKSNNEIE